MADAFVTNHVDEGGLSRAGGAVNTPRSKWTPEPSPRTTGVAAESTLATN
jgi:hypothetical protein